MTIDQHRVGLRRDTAFVESEANGDGRDAEEVLKRRVRQLAAIELETETRQVSDDAIVFKRAGILLASPITETREVRSVEISRVPGGTEVVGGIFQIRGRACGLVDLAPFFGASARVENGERCLVTVVSGTAGDVGLRTDEVIGPRRIYVDELDGGLTEPAVAFVIRVTSDLVHVIDIGRLLAFPRIRIGRQRSG